MFLSEKTVKNYLFNLLRKLKMQRRTELAAFAARLPVCYLSDALGPRNRFAGQTDGGTCSSDHDMPASVVVQSAVAPKATLPVAASSKPNHGATP